MRIESTVSALQIGVEATTGTRSRILDADYAVETANLVRARILREAGVAVTAQATNPIVPGWYADPEAAIFNKQYWIYPTYSAAYEKQVFFDAFSSVDWTITDDIFFIKIFL
mgnify:CR=1 FL=1